MIEEYFQQVENALREFPIIRSYALSKKVYNAQQGMISGKIMFENGSRLDFLEVIDIEREAKLKYRYHFMDRSLRLIFRYDNAPHHPQVKSFPHHKHIVKGIMTSIEPSLRDVLFEITRLVKKSRKK